MFLYKTSFENIVTASVNFDKNILLSQASLEPLKSIIPATVNLDKNVDLVGAAFNAAVVNRFNKNGDGIDTNTAIAFKKYFIHKPTNIEHKKQRVVGHIVNSAFSSYGENKILSDDDVRGTLNPFNIALAAVVYKTVDRQFADALMDSNDPESALFERISASWEIGFNEYLVAVGSLDLKQAEIITKKEQIEEFKKYLKGFDGPGVMNDGTPVYRLVTGRIYPLGIGFTTNPAADVQGVVIDDGTSAMKTENEEDEEDNEEEDNEENEMEVEEAECYEINSIDLLSLNNKLFSQSDKQPVNNTKTKIMDLEQILSALKTVLAEKQETVKFSEEAVASISAKIADSIKQKNEEIKLEMEKAEVAKAEAIAQAEQFKKDLEDNNKKLAETAAKLQELQNTISAQAAQEIYNSRMASLDNEYDLDEVDRSYLAKEISALATTDEAFASYKEKLAVIFRHKNKASKLDQDKIFQDRLEAELAKRMGQVKTQPTEVVEKTVEVETALANAKREEPTIPSQTNTPTVTKTSWKERLGKAFSKENITVKF
jgi:hypothetical protein